MPCPANVFLILHPCRAGEALANPIIRFSANFPLL
jgi:hypothetical protein